MELPCIPRPLLRSNPPNGSLVADGYGTRDVDRSVVTHRHSAETDECGVTTGIVHSFASVSYDRAGDDDEVKVRSIQHLIHVVAAVAIEDPTQLNPNWVRSVVQRI